MSELALAATDTSLNNDLKGALAVDFMNKNSRVIGFLSHQIQQLSRQRLAILRAFRETRKMCDVLLPGFYLDESEELTSDSDPKNEPKTEEPLQEAA